MEVKGGFQITTVIHCSYYTLFCLHSLPSSSQAPPLIWLALSKLLCEPPAHYSLLPHCISRVPCPVPSRRVSKTSSLNQWALVAGGCIKKTIQHVQWHAYFTSKQGLDERIPAAWNHLHAIRKHKVKVKVSLETLSCRWGLSTGENYAANVFSTAGDETLSARREHLRNNGMLANLS